MLNSNSIGNKIAAARKKVNLSQADLAQQVSISSQAVGKWERGESMPDITTLNRLAEIFGVDLNYFSDSFQSQPQETVTLEPNPSQTNDLKATTNSQMPSWDMSKLNLVDSDFSGLNNLHEKLSSTNILRCLFIESKMDGLLISNNNIEGCNFSKSDMRKSQFRGSNIGNNVFKDCSLVGTEFYKNNISACDFSNADLTSALLNACNFMNNNMEKAVFKMTSFKEMHIQDIIFSGDFENCYFENSSFYGVKFENATFTNTFFKNNQRFKKVQFVNCKADKISYAFLKNNAADMTGITLIA